MWGRPAVVRRYRVPFSVRTGNARPYIAAKNNRWRIPAGYLDSFLKQAIYSIPKVKQLLGCDIQNFAEFEDYIHRNAYIAQFNGADMAAVNICQFC